METKGSLTHLWEPNTSPYPDQQLNTFGSTTLPMILISKCKSVFDKSRYSKLIQKVCLFKQKFIEIKSD